MACSRYGRPYKPSQKALLNMQQEQKEALEHPLPSSASSDWRTKDEYIPPSGSDISSTTNPHELRHSQLQIDLEQDQASFLEEQLELQLKLQKLENKDKLSKLRKRLAEKQAEVRGHSVQSETSSVHPDSRTRAWVRSNCQAQPESVYKNSGNVNTIPSTTVIMANQGLPHLEVKSFEGNPLDWPEFILTFNNLVDTNSSLTDSQKLGYLKTFLGEDPTKQIFGLLLHGQNYEKALDELTKRYGNPAIVIEAFIKRVRRLPKLTDITGIPALNTEVAQLVHMFRTMGYDADLKAKGLLSDLTAKLPLSMRESWGRFVVQDSKGDPCVETFHKWLSRKEEAIRFGGGVGFDRAAKHYRGSKNDKMSSRQTTLAISKSEPQPFRKCQYCANKMHWISACDDFMKKSPKERLLWFKGEGRCFLCTKKSHTSFQCQSKMRCKVNGCDRKHATLLHDAFVKQNVSSVPEQTPPCDPSVNLVNDQVSEPHKVDAYVSTTTRPTTVYLQTLPVRLHTPNGRVVDTHALLDSGSQTTLIDRQFAADIGLNGPKVMLEIGNIKNNESPQDSKRVSFWVSDPGNPSMSPIKVHEAMTYEHAFNLPKQVFPRDQNGELEWAHLKGIDLPDIDPSQIKLLIGVNTKRALLHLDVREGPEHLPTGVRTPLGWTVMGGSSQKVNYVKANVNYVTESDNLSAQMEKFWAVESVGSTPNLIPDRPYSAQDKKALEHLESTVCLTEDGRYEVGMLWAQKPVELPNNRFLAERRYKLLERKLRRNPALCSRYSDVMNGYINSGYARKLTPQEVNETSDYTYYLPHHSVINPQKPEKLRVVFDAAAKFKGHSLNNALIVGPDLMSSLIGVLMRFRCGPVAISADIESMFHRVKVPTQDRDALRFLWKPDIATPGPPDVYQMCVHIFGAKCSPACANYCLKRSAIDNAEEFSEEAVQTILNNFYVDDMLKGLTDEEGASKLCLELVRICDKGGFKLTKWASNSQKVLDMLSAQPGVTTVIDLSLDEKTVTRTLGLVCDMRSDVFTFRIVKSDKPCTKRGILSAICSVFDPLGFVAPYTIRAKMFMQVLWEKGVDWDENISSDMSDWVKWIEQLAELPHVSIPRSYWPADFTPAEYKLHTFVDASERAYAAVCYIQIMSLSGKLYNNLVISKSRVAPTKSKCITLPRLELQAAILGVRLQRTVTSELKLAFAEVHYWSDSVIVLQYIRNDSKRFKTFVANRISEIRENSDPEQWHHVPGSLNPADDSTRGLNVNDLSPDHRWFKGPDFLWGPQEMWPSQEVLESGHDHNDAEVKHVNLVGVKEKVLNPADFSDIGRFQRVAAYCLRFLSNARASANRRKHGPLTVQETGNALLPWIKEDQRSTYLLEIRALSAGKAVPRDSDLLKVQPLLHEDVLRVGGRLENSHLPFVSRHQILLSRHSPIARLIVREAHEKMFHSGVEQVVAKVRRLYWIPRIRILAKDVIRNCVDCKIARAKPAVPKIGQLPPARVTDFHSVFHITACDYFGPLLIKRGRCREKRWGCLFTCLSIRAIHLELVSSLETDTFILALRRFIARRGPPAEMYSDNGTNFVGANKELKVALREIDQSRVSDVLNAKGIQWHFSPPRSPHFGGVWEVLVKSVKRALKSVIGKQCVHEDTLYTLLCEVESTVNSRPLTYVSTDVADPEPLTPSHFLMNKSVQVSSPVDTSCDDVNTRKRWRQTQVLADHYWRRWRREYLPSLTVANKWTSENPNLAVDDVVLMIDRNAPRATWPLGRVIDIFLGRDGRVRVVTVKTATGTYKRAASEVCILEAAS